jgi:hypothetical protein
MMLTITHPTTLRPVLIARLLEQQGSPLAPLAEEIYDLAIAYRIDAAFALAQWMVESQLGCLPLAQVNHNAALVRVALTRMPAPATADTGEARPILPLRYGDVYGSGYVTYPSWLAGLEEYFRLLRCVFVDAWHEEAVEQIAQRYLATTPGRRLAPAASAPAAPRVPAPPAKRHARKNRRRGAGAAPSGKAPALAQPPVSEQEIAAYARRIERCRAVFQGG